MLKPPDVTRMICRCCRLEKPIEDFRGSRGRTRVSCWVCVLSSQKTVSDTVGIRGDDGPECPVCLRRMHRNVDPRRKYCGDKCGKRARLWREYGLAPHEYHALIASSGQRCPICRSRVKRWHLDHNHETGESYGPVCLNCNVHLLAFSRHDPDLVKRLSAFLENPPIRAILGGRMYTGKKKASRVHTTWTHDRPTSEKEKHAAS